MACVHVVEHAAVAVACLSYGLRSMLDPDGRPELAAAAATNYQMA